MYCPASRWYVRYTSAFAPTQLLDGGDAVVRQDGDRRHHRRVEFGRDLAVRSDQTHRPEVHEVRQFAGAQLVDHHADPEDIEARTGRLVTALSWPFSSNIVHPFVEGTAAVTRVTGDRTAESSDGRVLGRAGGCQSPQCVELRGSRCRLEGRLATPSVRTRRPGLLLRGFACSLMLEMAAILIDTSVWINLTTPPMAPLVGELGRVMSAGADAIVVPESVAVEFARNKPDLAKRWENSYRGYLSNLKQLRPLIPQLDSQLTEVIKASNQALDKGAGDVERATQSIQALIDKAKRRNHLDNEYSEAGRRCLGHRAPARTPQRSSMGDCLLWLSALQLLEKSPVWFCTTNHSDFSHPMRHDILHPELAEEVSHKAHHLHYYTDPSKFIVDLIARAQLSPPPSPIPEYAHYFPGASGICPNCGDRLIDAGWSPSMFGGQSWKMRCARCKDSYDTGEFMDC